MTTIRMLLPYLMGAMGSLAIIWWIIYQINKNLPEFKPWPKTIGIIITSFVILMFFMYSVNMGSVNEVPRSVIDRQVPSDMKENFQQRAVEAAAKHRDSSVTY